jgi:LacI family transcriptional regulator
MEERAPTVRDVAALAEVSTATVSRALGAEGGDLVALETRERVLWAAKKLNYTANHVARSLKTRATRTVAIVAPELANEFFMELAEGMEKELEAQGYTLLVASSSNSIQGERQRLETLAERLVDGVVVIPAGSQGDHLGLLAKRGIPVVLVDRLVEGSVLDAVLSDNEAGAAELTRSLLAEGYRRIAFVGGDVTISTARERLSGYARALAEQGLSPGREDLWLGGMGIDEGYQRMNEILGLPPPALVAVNLLVHLGIQRRLLEESETPGPPVTRAGTRGHREGVAGRRFAIAAFDETPYSPFLPFCHYTAAQDATGLGRAAARKILSKIKLNAEGKVNGESRNETEESKKVEILRLPVRIIKHIHGETRDGRRR